MMNKKLNPFGCSLLICLTSLLIGCTGTGSSSSSSSSSSTTSASSSTTSSTSSTSSSSSSGCFVGSGIPIGSTGSTSSSSSSGGEASIVVKRMCASSVGTTQGNEFKLENSIKGRIDFPEVGKSRAADLHSGWVSFAYSNPNPQSVPVKVWLNSPLLPIDFEMPPTGEEWQTASFTIKSAQQLSITATGANGSVSIRNPYYYWRTGWDFDNLLEIGECPTAPLPGIGAAIPQAPTPVFTIKQTITDACGSRVTDSNGGRVNDTFDFDASASTDPNIEPLQFSWDFKDGTIAEGAKVSHSFSKPGFYFVELTVTDPSGLSAKKIKRMQISVNNPANHAPAPIFTANKYNLLKPYTKAQLWGDVSYDVDGDPIEHIWHAENLQGPIQEPIYGSKVEMDLPVSPWTWITLNVADGRGGLNYTSRLFQVEDYPGQDCEVTYSAYTQGQFSMQVKMYNNTSSPIRNWQSAWTTQATLSSLQLNTNDKYAFNLTGNKSFTVGGETIPEYSWVEFNLSGASPTDVRSIGFKPQNGMQCIEHMPEKENLAPTAKITVDKTSGTLPFKVNLSAAGSADPEGKELVRYNWSFGDGTFGSGKTVSHTFESKGSYDVWLTVSTETSTSSTDTGSTYLRINVDGNQNIGCFPSITPTGNPNEYFIKAVYWHKNFSYNYRTENSSLTPVYLTSGRINLSAPVTVTQAAAETGVKLNTSTDIIAFNMNKNLQPGETEAVRITAKVDDISKLFATGCSFK